MKKTEVIKVITELKKIFEIVRLIDLDNMSYMELDDEGNLIENPSKCHEFFDKPAMCQKCVAAGSCKKNIRLEKFEYINDELYNISSRTIMIDGKKFALELISKEESGDSKDAEDNIGCSDIIGELTQKLYIDSVTGILNRRYYEERPHIYNGKYAAALIDVDDFSNIIENHGHVTGDGIIKAIVGVVKENIRKDDVFIHYGKDEFLVMFPEISEDRFLEKMNNIRLDIAALHTEEEGLKYTVSIGCATRDDDKVISFDDLDRQLYVAKRMRNAVAYRNKVLFFEGSSYAKRRASDADAHTPMYSADYTGASKQVLDSFKREYNSLYLVDLSSDRLYPCNRSTSSSGLLDRNPDEGFIYSEQLEKYIKDNVADVDKDWIRRQLSLPKLSNNLKSKGDIVYTYRVNIKDEEHFYRMRVTSVGESDDLRFAIIGFADKNLEVVNELVMDSLMNEYNSIFVVDLKQQTVRSLKNSSAFPELNIDGSDYCSLARRSLKYIDRKFKREFYKMGGVKYVQDIFRNIDRRELIFRLAVGEKQWKKAIFGVLERQRGEAVTMVYCFGDIDQYRVKELEYQKMIEEQEEYLERTVRERTRELYKANRQLRKLNEQIVDFVGYIVEGRDFTSGKHIARVKVYTAILASKVRNMLPEYELSSKDVEAIVAASPLHDMGKVAIPDSLLLKPGKLTDEEFDLMKQHTLIGYEILKKAPKDWDRRTKEKGLEICRSHHERVDGRGYPDGLKGDEIPISAQIVGIADCFDALTSKRPYKDAFSREEAFRMILDGECGAFSEKLLECFRACEEEFMKKR